MTPDAEDAGRSLAVSLSGGGHRASLFTLGALLYLVESSANRDVSSIASVSGGSITNAFIGQTLDFKLTTPSDFRGVARQLTTQLATRGSLFAPLRTWLYVLFLVVGLAFVFWPFYGFSGAWYVRLLLFIALLSAWGWLFALRGTVCASAFEKELFSPGGGSGTQLTQLNQAGIDHVICATELRAAQQVFMAGGFVYSYQLGHGVAGDLSVARCVQASASIPGGFPPVRLPTKSHAFTGRPSRGGPTKPPTSMVMMDGGVYDNMGDEWARSFNDRCERWPELLNGRTPPNRLVVVNASARVPWTDFKRALLPLIGEIATLLRVSSVMYVNTTNVRRQQIVGSYDPRNPEATRGLASVLVQIAQSPFNVADAYKAGQDAAGARARAVLATLGDTHETRDWWQSSAERNVAVPTSLNKMGRDVSIRLVMQGFAVAMCNLHVLFGDEFPLLPVRLVPESFMDLVTE